MKLPFQKQYFEYSRNIVDKEEALRSSGSMEILQAARCLDKLGNPTRLEVFRLLVKAGREGLPVGEIQEHLDVPASTLSHHISHLVNAGLVHQEREGRVLRCRPDFELMESLMNFMTEECCEGVGAAQQKRDAG